MRGKILLTVPMFIVGIPLAAQSVNASAVRTQVQQFVRTYIANHNLADATSLSEAVSRRPEVTSVSDGEITRGWDAIRTATDEIAGMEGRIKVAIGTMDVTLLGTSYALVVAPTTITGQNEQGQTVQIRGAATLVLEKTSEGWKVLNEHYSTKTVEQ